MRRRWRVLAWVLALALVVGGTALASTITGTVAGVDKYGNLT